MDQSPEIFTEGERLAYAAGLLDGEGCIQISKRPIRARRRSNEFCLRVIIGMSNSEPIMWLQRNFGGAVRQASPNKRLPSRKTVWVWELRRTEASNLLFRILPCLKVKDYEAILGILLQDSFHSTLHIGQMRVPKNLLEVRELLWEECKLAKAFNG